jgi:hypothetical protein
MLRVAARVPCATARPKSSEKVAMSASTTSIAATRRVPPAREQPHTHERSAAQHTCVRRGRRRSRRRRVRHAPAVAVGTAGGGAAAGIMAATRRARLREQRERAGECWECAALIE